MATLVIFDIDGTLLRAHWKDPNSDPYNVFSRAFESHFGVENVSHQSEDYSHQTDACWTDEAHRRHFGRALGQAETEAFWDYYLDLWEEATPAEMDLRLIPGAERVFEQLAGLSMKLAIASGGLRRMQEFKLRRAGLSFEHLPHAYADHGYTREDITRHAQKQFADDGIERTVYIGDARWDVESCRNLGMPFIGMGARHKELIKHGATHALPDYTNEDAFPEAVAECGAP